jgi:ATP-dependent RNA helicase DDX58
MTYLTFLLFLFLNSQILVNAFKLGEMKITDIDMLIMDECHHTNLEHSYNAIMAFYHEVRPGNPSAKLPQVIGLTASLGVGDSDD